MGKKDAGFLGGLIAAAAYGGLGWSGRGLKTCTLCREAIVPPAGYRVVPGGFAHGACAQKAEGGGKDASQGQADGAPDPGSVCPEG